MSLYVEAIPEPHTFHHWIVIYKYIKTNQHIHYNRRYYSNECSKRGWYSRLYVFVYKTQRLQLDFAIKKPRRFWGTNIEDWGRYDTGISITKKLNIVSKRKNELPDGPSFFLQQDSSINLSFEVALFKDWGKKFIILYVMRT